MKNFRTHTAAFKKFFSVVFVLTAFALNGVGQFSKSGDVVTINIKNGYTLTSSDCAQINASTTIRFTEKWNGNVDMSSCGMIECRGFQFDAVPDKVIFSELIIHGDLTMNASQIRLSGDLTIEGNLTMSGQGCQIEGTANVEGNLTMSGPQTSITTLKFINNGTTTHTVSRTDPGWGGSGHPTITTLQYGEGSTINYTGMNSSTAIGSIEEYSTGISVPDIAGGCASTYVPTVPAEIIAGDYNTKWQISNDGSAWSDAPATLTDQAGKQFRLAVEESAGKWRYSNAITLAGTPIVPTLVAPAAICPGVAPSMPEVSANDNGSPITSTQWLLEDNSVWTPAAITTPTTVKYKATNACGDSESPNTITLTVGTPSINNLTMNTSTGVSATSTTVATVTDVDKFCQKAATNVVYSLSGTGAGNFTINPSTGEVKNIAGTPIGNYDITVTATMEGTNGVMYTTAKNLNIEVVDAPTISIECADNKSQSVTLSPCSDRGAELVFKIPNNGMTGNIDLEWQSQDIGQFQGLLSSVPAGTQEVIVRQRDGQYFNPGQNVQLVLWRVSTKRGDTHADVQATCDQNNDRFKFTVPSSDMKGNTTISSPNNQACSGSDVELTAGTASITTALPDECIEYRWLKDNAQIAITTDPTYTIPNITEANEGAYTVEARYTRDGNKKATHSGDPVVVDVTTSFYDERHMDDFSACGNVIPELEVYAVSCGGELTYQWYESANADGSGATAIAGATLRTFTPAEPASDETKYFYCVIENTVPSVAVPAVKQSKIVKGIFKPSTKSFDITINNGTTNALGVKEFYCSQEISASVSEGFKRYVWTLGNQTVSTGSGNTASLALDCSESPLPTSLSVVVTDQGCDYQSSIPISVKPMGRKYYYCGLNNNSSDVTNLSNWKTDAGCSGGSTPPNFTSDGCEYVITRDDVILKADQTWNVSGLGSVITLGTGKWESNFGFSGSVPKSGGGSLSLGTGDGRYPDGSWGAYLATIDNHSAKQELAVTSKIADADLRSSAKQFRVEGTMNLTGGVEMNVTRGSELIIATDQGTPTINKCEADLLVCRYGGTDCFDNKDERSGVAVIPGGIVTYEGAGATKIQPAEYSNVFVNTPGVVGIESGVTLDIFQNFKFDQTPSGFDTDGSTVIYAGKVNQNMAPMVYDNVEIYNPSTKTLTGNTTVNGNLHIGAGSTLSGNKTTAYDLNLTKCDQTNAEGETATAITYEGFFVAGKSTVNYSGACKQTVAAMYYNNLNTVGGERAFEAKSVVGVSGTFTADPSATNTTAGSTIGFNGTSAQTIPGLTYDRLVINNTALGKGFSEANTLSLAGDVNITNQLVLTNGVVTTGSHNLTILNTQPKALMNGHYTSNTDQAFINGEVTYHLPANQNGTNLVDQFCFPIGNMTNGYLPLFISEIVTGSSPVVTVSAIAGIDGNPGTGLTSLSSNYHWQVEGTNYTQGRVSISKEHNAALDSDNTVAYKANGSSDYVSLKGTTLTSTMIRSNASGVGDYTLAIRSKNAKTYYFDCNASGNDITDITKWKDDSNNQPPSFSEDDATWVVRCNDAVVPADEDEMPFVIEGSNTVVKTNPGAKLTINGDAIFTALYISASGSNGSKVEVDENANFTILEKFELQESPIGDDHKVHTSTRVATLENFGTMNIISEAFKIDDAFVINHGTMNITNCEMSILCTGSSTQSYSAAGQAGHFQNFGKVNMVNSGLEVRGRYTQLRNANGASWVIDNRNSSTERIIIFNTMELATHNEDFVSFECGSNFVVRNSDVDIRFKGDNSDNADIAGTFIVEDGNLSIVRSDGNNGGKVNIKSDCGQVLLYDTDNSGDGMFIHGYKEGYQVNIEGVLYTRSLATEGGSGSKVTVKDGGFVFIGDMGATFDGYTWNTALNIESGGTLNYCGNVTSAADNIGSNSGTLNYSENYYGSDDPYNQGDFASGDVEAIFYAAFQSMQECMMAFTEGAGAEVTGGLLPVEMTMLYGVCINAIVELHWQTASEVNNSHFLIYRSIDGVNFEEIDMVFGNGTTSEVHDYVYTDTELDFSGVVYYKVRQVDFDGKYVDSKVIAIQTCGKNAHFTIKKDEIEVNFANSKSHNYVVITSISGQIMYSKPFTDVESARIAKPTKEGIYIISVIDNKQITSEVFIR